MQDHDYKKIEQEQKMRMLENELANLRQISKQKDRTLVELEQQYHLEDFSKSENNQIALVAEENVRLSNLIKERKKTIEQLSV